MNDQPRNNEPKPRGRPFSKGNAGKPRGARHRATALAEKLLSKDIEKVVEAVQAAAEAGDMVACKLILDRLAPAPKGRLVAFNLPGINTAADAENAIGAVLAAVAGGKLTVDEGDKLAGIIERKAEATHLRELTDRLAALEAAGKPQELTYRRVA